MSKDKHPNWGGKREGAGSSPRGSKVRKTVSASLHPDVIKALTEAAKRKGVSRSEMMEYALTGYLMEHEGLTLVL